MSLASLNVYVYVNVCFSLWGATRVLPQADLPHPIWNAPQLCCQLAAWNYLYRISVKYECLSMSALMACIPRIIPTLMMQ